MNDLSTDIHNAALSDWVKDTWKKDCVTNIDIEGRVPLFEKEWMWICTIRTKNGGTRGTQEIKGSDLKILLSQIELFLKTLP